MIVTGTSTTAISSFKKEMMSLFKMSDLGLLSYYLGIEVTQKPGLITLGQAAYAEKLLERMGMSGCNPTAVPMEPRLKLSKQGAGEAVDAAEYRSVVGGLRYLVHTRPDICFAVSYLSRFMEAPTNEHWSGVKHLLRYISGTLSNGCVYRRGDCETLRGFSDSDHARDVDSRKSTSDMLFFLGDSSISWQSHKQKFVAASSCEAEYIAGDGGVSRHLARASLWRASEPRSSTHRPSLCSSTTSLQSRFVRIQFFMIAVSILIFATTSSVTASRRELLSWSSLERRSRRQVN
jgi:hypothetical protein